MNNSTVFFHKYDDKGSLCIERSLRDKSTDTFCLSIVRDFEKPYNGQRILWIPNLDRAQVEGNGLDLFLSQYDMNRGYRTTSLDLEFRDSCVHVDMAVQLAAAGFIFYTNF